MVYVARHIRDTNQMIDMLLFMRPGALDPGDARYFPVMPSFEPRPASDDDFETDIDSNGTLTIARKGDGLLRTPDAALVHIQTGQSVCNACLSALGYLARHLEETITVPDREEMEPAGTYEVAVGWMSPMLAHLGVLRSRDFLLFRDYARLAG